MMGWFVVVYSLLEDLFGVGVMLVNARHPRPSGYQWRRAPLDPPLH
jgi:hypothetical protein